MTAIELIETQAGLLLIGTVPSVIALVKAFATEKVADLNTGRLDRQGARISVQDGKIEHLSNGGGDAKIDARMQLHGVIPGLQGYANGARTPQEARTRATDPPHAPAPTMVGATPTMVGATQLGGSLGPADGMQSPQDSTQVEGGTE